MLTKKNRIVLIFIFCFVNSAICQESFTLYGKIVINDTTPLSYAHIGIPYLGIGTVSNIQGDFKVKLKCQSNDTLHFSHLGYETQKIPVMDFDSGSFVVLSPKFTEITDVVIIPKESLQEILQKSIKAIKSNYPNKLHFMKGFYREVQYNLNDNNYTRLIEAAINVQDPGVKKSTEAIRVNADHLRKSDQRSTETFYSKIIKKSFPERFNYLYRSLRDSPVRDYYYKKSQGRDPILHLLANDSLTKLTLNKTIIEEENKVYEIFYKNDDGFRVREGKIYINDLDMAVLKIEDIFYLKGYKEETKFFYQIEYKEFSGKYYPIMIHNIHFADSRKVGGNKAIGISDNKIIFTDYFFKRNDFDRIKRKFDLKNKGDLYDIESTYDSIFWASYNILIEEPLKVQVKKDLEEIESLSKQFIKNSR